MTAHRYRKSLLSDDILGDERINTASAGLVLYFFDMAPLPEVLKIDLRVQVNDQPLVISAQVQGEGEHARRAAAELSTAIAAVLAAIDRPDDSAAPVRGTASPPTQPEIAQLTHNAPDTPARDAVIGAAKPPIEKTSDSSSDTQTHPATPSLAAYMQRYRIQINLGLGGVLLALAVLVPAIVPAEERREVLIMTILFGLTGALLLFTAMLPGSNRQATTTNLPRVHQPAAPSATRVETSAARLRLFAKRQTPMRAGWGIALGITFVLLGILAPFTLGATTADERFIIMLGFAPVTVVGFFLIAIFGRSLVTQRYATPQPHPAIQPVSASATKRAPVTRMPQTFEYRAIVPAAIIGLLVIMIVVVGVVIYATVASAVR